jgi:subtilisin-like proprotein convertase family protein
MKYPRSTSSIRKIAFGILVGVLAWMTSPTPQAVVFTNASAITIPSLGNGSPYPSNIIVSGLSGTITGLSVTLNGLSHTFLDDVGILLTGPGGALLLMDGVSDGVVTNATVTLQDGAAAMPDTGALVTGTYKPTAFFTGDSFPAPGPGTTYNHPGPSGGNTATFASTFNGTAANGTWSLYVVDFASGDSGSISGGWSLNITTNGAPAHPTVIDFDGDHKTDFAVVRNTGGGPTGQITWFYQGTSGFKAAAWGIASDEYVPSGDLDSDGKVDIGIWRAAPQAVYYYLRSSDGGVVALPWGTVGDDPSVDGDYDGDGLNDPTVYRAGPASGNPSFWYSRKSTNAQMLVSQFGQNGDFPSPGDYDGDGKWDYIVQRNAGGGQARFWMQLSTSGFTSTVFGTPTDVIVPGDYDGDGKTDIATVRGSGGQILWSMLPSSGGPYVQTFWGNSATDFPCQGDWDGDGKTDQAIWRPSATPGQSAFWILKSSGGFMYVPFGQNGDYPVGNYNTH